MEGGTSKAVQFQAGAGGANVSPDPEPSTGEERTQEAEAPGLAD